MLGAGTTQGLGSVARIPSAAGVGQQAQAAEVETARSTEKPEAGSGCGEPLAMSPAATGPGPHPTAPATGTCVPVATRRLKAALMPRGP